MVRFIKKLEKTLADSPRDIRVVYVHPPEEDVLSKAIFLQKIYEERKKDDFVIYQSVFH